MQGEFKLPHEYLLWWLTTAPKRIFITGKRFLILTNNSLSFTLNLRLLFTPLFGDYTFVGRMIGFTIRIVEVFFGLVFMLLISLIVLILPFLWLAAPLIIFYFLKFWVVLIYIALYFIWAFFSRNTPKKKVSVTNTENFLDSFRPLSKRLINVLDSNFPVGIRELMELKEIKYLLTKCELSQQEFVNKILTAPKFDTSGLAQASFNEAVKEKTRYVEPEHVFFAFISSIPKPEVLLATFGTKPDVLEKSIQWVVSEREHLAKIYIWQEDCEMLFVGGIGKGMTGRVTPFLDTISEDFTRQAQKGRIEKIVGREQEIKKIADLLTGTKENVLIVGEPGSGKTSVIKGIAYKIIEGTDYKALVNKRIVRLDIGSIISGAKTAGDISAKLNKALEELKGSGDIILFIDEIHNLVTTSGDKSAETSSVYSILEPHLISDQIQFIGATSVPNYRKYIEPNGAFNRLFTLVEIKEASKEDTMEILKSRSSKAQKQSKVLVTYPSLVKILELCEKLIHERVLPDKALDILNRVVSVASQGTKIVNSSVVLEEVAEMTNIPSEVISQDEAEKVLQLESQMKKMVIGQDHAIKQIGSALKRARVGIRNKNKPIASFLFVGTTGVGKTQTAKALAKSYFNNSKSLIRIDMSEYQQADSIDRLLGNPDGSSKGQLTEAVRTKPFSLILLDEIEKAHPNILLTFLQVLDDGVLTDSSGVTVSFDNTIIIATSNVGTRSIQQVFERGGTLEEMDTIANKEVKERFAPEFLNRFSGIIVFNPLTIDNVGNICKLLLEEIIKIAEEKGVKLTIKQEVVNELIKRGYNPEWGARPLARVIEDTVESYIATKMLKNEIKQGDVVNLGTEVFADTLE